MEAGSTETDLDDNTINTDTNEVHICNENIAKPSHVGLGSIVLQDPFCSGSLTTLDRATTSDGNENIVSKPCRSTVTSNEGLSCYQGDDKDAEACAPGCLCVQKVEGKDAWIAAVMSMIITFAIASEFGSFGIYYVEYTNYFQASKASVGWIKGIQTLAGGIFGFVGGSFVKVYGSRMMAFMGTLCSFIGMLSASFSQDVYILYITQGIILGIGLNIMNMSTAVIIQRHFTRNRVLGSGISFMGFSLGALTSPLFVSALIDKYGVRGSLLVHSAIIAHGMPAALLLREAKQKKCKDAPPYLQRTVTVERQKSEPLSSQIWKDICNFSLLRNNMFVLTVVSGFLTFYNISSYVNHLPGRAVSLGIPRSKAAYLQSVVSFTSLCIRIPSTFMANIKYVDKIVYYSVTMWFVALGPFTYAFMTDINTLVISPIVFGFGMGSSTTVFFVVLVRLYGIDQLPKVIGFYSIAISLGQSLGPPISGLIFDITGNYDTPFLIAGIVGMCANLVFIAVMFMNRQRERTMLAADGSPHPKL